MRWRERWRVQPPWTKCLLVAYVAGFTDGTAAHVRDLARGGLTAYSGYGPVAAQVFFVGLVLLDPLLVVLLVLMRPAAAWLAAGVMALDMTANWYDNWSRVTEHPSRYLAGMLPISLFGLFVLVTFIPLWRSLSAAGRRARGPGGPAPRAPDAPGVAG